MKINRYTKGIDEMMANLINGGHNSDLVYELTMLADTARLLVEEEASHRVMYNFVLDNYKNKHPYVQFLVGRVRNLLDTLQFKNYGRIVVKNTLIDFIKLTK